MIWLLVPVIALLALLGAPLFAVMALVTLHAFATHAIDTVSVAIEMYRMAEAPMLVAIPLFTFAGYLLSEGGAPRRLVRLSRALLGWVPGGLALVALMACAIFTAFTGASGVTIIAMGGLLLPVLRAEKYGERFTFGLLTTSGSLGLLFPPSLPIILVAYVAAVSVDQLFVAGVLPGFLLLVVLAGYAMYSARRLHLARQPFSWQELVRAGRAAAWEIPLPFVILGGIYSGKVTVTEAASLTAMYADLPQADRACGEGPPELLEAVARQVGVPVLGPPAAHPSAVALLGLVGVPGGAARVVSPAEWEPVYGRPAEAQVQWELRHDRPFPDPQRHPGLRAQAGRAGA